jgi:hypothetical protein
MWACGWLGLRPGWGWRRRTDGVWSQPARPCRPAPARRPGAWAEAASGRHAAAEGFACASGLRGSVARVPAGSAVPAPGVMRIVYWTRVSSGVLPAVTTQYRQRGRVGGLNELPVAPDELDAAGCRPVGGLAGVLRRVIRDARPPGDQRQSEVILRRVDQSDAEAYSAGLGMVGEAETVRLALSRDTRGECTDRPSCRRCDSRTQMTAAKES